MLLAKKKDLNITSDPLFFAIIRFSIPIMLANVVTTLFNAADMMVLSWFAVGNEIASVGATSRHSLHCYRQKGSSSSCRRRGCHPRRTVSDQVDYGWNTEPCPHRFRPRLRSTWGRGRGYRRRNPGRSSHSWDRKCRCLCKQGRQRNPDSTGFLLHS